MKKHERDIVAMERERSHSHESESCRRCSSPLHFGTDGMGYLVPQCPHCDWHWPAPRARPIMPTCEHGVGVDESCRKCLEKRHAIREGLREYYRSKTHQRTTYAQQRAAANAKGWATRRRNRGEEN